MTSSRKPRYNRCDACGRNAHKVAVREPIMRRLNDGYATRVPSGQFEIHGYCPSCYSRKEESVLADPLRTVIYDRRARKS